MFSLFFGSSIHMYCIIVTSRYPGILSWGLLFSPSPSVVTPSEKISLLLQQPGTKPHPALSMAQSYRLGWCWYPQLPCSMAAITKSLCVQQHFKALVPTLQLLNSLYPPLCNVSRTPVRPCVTHGHCLRLSAHQSLILSTWTGYKSLH